MITLTAAPTKNEAQVEGEKYVYTGVLCSTRYSPKNERVYYRIALYKANGLPIKLEDPVIAQNKKLDKTSALLNASLPVYAAEKLNLPYQSEQDHKVFITFVAGPLLSTEIRTSLKQPVFRVKDMRIIAVDKEEKNVFVFTKVNQTKTNTEYVEIDPA